MDSPIKQYILDREDVGTLEFDYNYTADKYAAVKAKADGKTVQKFLITYSDGSGVKFDGMGKTWRDTVSTGGEIKGKLAIAITSKDDVDDCTSIVDASTIPAGRTSPFSAYICSQEKSAAIIAGTEFEVGDFYDFLNFYFSDA